MAPHQTGVGFHASTSACSALWSPTPHLAWPVSCLYDPDCWSSGDRPKGPRRLLGSPALLTLITALASCDFRSAFDREWARFLCRCLLIDTKALMLAQGCKIKRSTLFENISWAAVLSCLFLLSPPSPSTPTLGSLSYLSIRVLSGYLSSPGLELVIFRMGFIISSPGCRACWVREPAQCFAQRRWPMNVVCIFFLFTAPSTLGIDLL